MDEPLTILFFGRPGSGKGTQSQLLAAHLEQRVFLFEWSPLIRAFMQGDSAVQKHARAITDAGGRLPAFFAPSLWLPELRDRITPEEHLLVDGLPRHILEAELFDSLMDFHERSVVHVINLDVSEEVARERLIKRGREDGRSDDLSDEAIEKRLNWFNTDTAPLADFFSKRSRYKSINIDAIQSREEVRDAILAGLKVPA